MTDFETACQRHGENLLWDILENWERYARVVHARVMTLEERWTYFIRATEPAPMAIAA